MSGRRTQPKSKKEKIEIEIVDRKPTARSQALTPRKKTGDREKSAKRSAPQMSDRQNAAVTFPRPGLPVNRSIAPSVASQNTLAHMMSILNPWDPKYNGAKVPNAAPVDSAVFKTHEIITVGCPTIAVAPQVNTSDQVFTGFGGFVMRPNALGRSYAYTPGTSYLGWQELPSIDFGGGLVAFTPEGGNQSLILNMIGQSASDTVPMPNTNTNIAGWISPLAMEDIQLLCSKYRVVSAGLVARYIGPAITGSGMIAAGCVPYNQLQTKAIDAFNGATPFPYMGLDWQQFINLKDVVTAPAMQGINMVYVPRDDRAYEWKETVLTFPFPTLDNITMLQATSSQVRQAQKRGQLSSLIQLAARRAGVKAKELGDGRVHISAAVTLTKTLDQNGKVVHKKAAVHDLPETTTTNGFGAVPNPDSAMIPFTYGIGGEGLAQPEDTPSGLAALFAQSVFGAYGLSDPPAMDEPDLDNINQMLNIYSDSVWSEAEDLMVIMWNGIAPADAVLNAGATSVWAGNLFEIDKYVNYECILDLNALSIGNAPASPGSYGAPSAGPAIAKAIQPSVALVGKPKSSESWLQKAGDWLSSAKDKVAPWIEAGSKAFQVASAIGDVLGAFV